LPLFLKSKTGLPLKGSHGNPVLLPSDFGNPAIPGGTRGFPPHDYSWFGFIGFFLL
jgi:hypothetical protein